MGKVVPFLVSGLLGVLLAGLDAALNLSGEVVYLTGALVGALLVAISAPLVLREQERPVAGESRPRRAPKRAA